IFSGLVAALTFVTLGLSSGTASAASASMSIQSSNHTVGETFTATVYEDGGDQSINTVDAYFTVSDASKLQVIGVSYPDSFEKASPAPACTASFCVLAGVIGNGLPGSNLVAVVTFKALATGTVPVNFTANSRIISGTTNTAVSADKLNGTYSFSEPASAQSGTTSNSGSTSRPTTTSTTKKTATTSNSGSSTPSTGAVAGEVTTNTETKDAEKKDEKKSDNKKDDTENTSSSSSNWFWPLAILAVVAGYVAARVARSRAATKATASEAKEAAAKPAANSGKPKNSSNKKK
ncbi:MAG: hypothetical protein AAB834_00785, partial [Patescibacteria group bacterium]